MEEFISPDIPNILGRTYNDPSPNRVGQLLHQLQELRSSQQFLFTDFAWGRHEAEEPLILPDTGAKDGLRGGSWDIHVGAWAAKHGHKRSCSQLPKRRTVSGIGSGTQHVDDSVRALLVWRIRITSTTLATTVQP